LNVRQFLFRCWFYFRIGYSTYLTFLLGFVSTIVTVYYLAINNIPVLKTVFPSFLLFSTIAVAVGVPLSVLAGYTHFKRSRAYSAEVDIGVEANPYLYKVTPGKEREIAVPLTIASIDVSLAMARKLGVLTPETESAYLEAREKYVRLVKDGDYRAPA
jgi:hypothetical protein